LFNAYCNSAQTLPQLAQQPERSHPQNRPGKLHLLFACPTGTISLAFADNQQRYRTTLQLDLHRKKTLPDGSFTGIRRGRPRLALYRHLKGETRKLTPGGCNRAGK